MARGDSPPLPSPARGKGHVRRPLNGRSRLALRLPGLRRRAPQMGRALRDLRRMEQRGRGGRHRRRRAGRAEGRAQGSQGHLRDADRRYPAAAPPGHRHRRAGPGVRRWPGAGLGHPAGRRPRHRQVDHRAAGCRQAGAEGHQMPLPLGRGGDGPGPPEGPAPGPGGFARGARRGDQRERHHHQPGRRADRRRGRRFDPDHVPRHTRFRRPARSAR